MGRKKELIVNITKFRNTVNRRNESILDFKIKNDVRTLSSQENLKKQGVFNQQWVAEKFPHLFERKFKEVTVNGIKSTVGYNIMKTLKEVKAENKGFEKKAIRDYNQELEDLARFTGIDINELSKGTIKNVDEIARQLQYSRNIEIENTTWKSNADYETTRQWSSDDWREVDEYKNHLNSDDAIDLKYAIDVGDLDTVRHFVEISGNSGLKEKIGRVIDIDKLMNEELFEE